ncbi:hypothetical protein JTE90_024106 [Oedothorax gibbosus]|uniref:Uncharacterized protein n=1 Tax=Oedothorax gibbosus TaxID=931172 RepID=A0AAV6UQW3_9ARAC|nr:hypothetical protein JTE90_024106 [Oedothorax gibbosus]
MMSTEVKSENLEEILQSSIELIHCISPKADMEHQEKLGKLIIKLFLLAESQVGNVKWVAKLRDKLNCVESLSFSSTSFENQSSFTIKEMQMEHLTLKFSVLEKTLDRKSLNSQLVHNFSTYESDKSLQVVVEMLLLDIMSIFEDSNKNLTDNLLYLDENSPVLVGRNLRNHLAHGNALCDILQNKSSVSIALNAKKIILENITQQKKKIGKLIKNDPIKVKTRCEQNLKIMEVQNSLFFALKNGNLEDLNKCIREGADVQARNKHLWTSLHFAAQGGNIQIGSFLVEQNLDVKATNKNGQTPIHIASAFGHKDMVQLLLKRNVDVKVVDYSLKTPLHFAAQNGHTAVIKLLLRNKASPASTDMSGCMPIQYAIVFNHQEATEILLAEQKINASVMSS